MNARPQLRADLVIVEQTFQGEQSYVVKDPAAQKYFRFKPLEAFVLQHFTGDATATEIAAQLAAAGVTVSAATVTGFARRLAHMDLFERSVAEKSVMQLERLRTERRRRLKGRAYEGSILRMRWSVGNPDAILDAWLPRLRFLFTPTFLALSTALFLVYGVILATHWTAISHGLGTLLDPRTLTVTKIVVMWATIMAIIAIHELGHAFTCKYFGGQVAEIGAMLLYFQPAFFCNVNDAWTFPELRKRLWVTAAGSWIQLIIAALAAIAWLVLDPGSLLADAALTAVVIGGVMTVAANANPLLPLDGYYALSDWLEIPNLRIRAFAHLSWWIKRHVLRLAVPEPPADDRERRILLTYAVLANLYIWSMLLLIGARAFGWVSRTVGAVGVFGFTLGVLALLRAPAQEWLRAVVTAVREHRAGWAARGVWRTGGIALAGLLLAGLLIPWPRVVTGRFAVEPRVQFALAAPDDAVVTRVYAPEGAVVPAGAPLVQLRSFALEGEVLALAVAVDSLDAERRRAVAAGQADAIRQLGTLRAEQEARRSAIASRVAALTLRAPVTGVVVTPRTNELSGRKVEAGDVVVRFQRADTVMVRIRLERAGARAVAPGQVVRLLPEVDRAAARRATVSELAARGDSAGIVEARVFLPGGAVAFRPGAVGEAEVIVARSSILGALWWGIRKRIRGDILL